MTSTALAAFIDLGDPCDGCHQTRWPKAVEWLNPEWLSARYRCKPCGREWSVGWPTKKGN